MLGIEIFRGSKSSCTTEIYFAAAATIKDLIFLGGYILTFYFPKCPKCTRRRIAPRGFQRKEEKSKEYGTFKESDRVSAPSNTEFQVQYTGEFEHISG